MEGTYFPLLFRADSRWSQQFDSVSKTIQRKSMAHESRAKRKKVAQKIELSQRYFRKHSKTRESKIHSYKSHKIEQ